MLSKQMGRPFVPNACGPVCRGLGLGLLLAALSACGSSKHAGTAESGAPGSPTASGTNGMPASGGASSTGNVFGRDLSGTAKVTSRGGRDHFGNHSVMLMIGKNVKPGVTGGVTEISNGVFGASDIDSSTGASVASGGDIARADTHVAAAKTLGLALGIDAALLDPDFTDGGTVKSVPASIAS